MRSPNHLGNENHPSPLYQSNCRYRKRFKPERSGSTRAVLLNMPAILQRKRLQNGWKKNRFPKKKTFFFKTFVFHYLSLFRKFCEFCLYFEPHSLIYCYRADRWPSNMIVNFRPAQRRRVLLVTPSPPTSRPWTAASPCPFKIEKSSNRHRF